MDKLWAMMEALTGYTIGQSKAQWREDTGAVPAAVAIYGDHACC
jgi:hypothetical protein